MTDKRLSEITIKIGDIIDLGDITNPQEWLIEGFNPDGSIIITRRGRWKTIGFKQGSAHINDALEPANIPRQKPMTRF